MRRRVVVVVLQPKPSKRPIEFSKLILLLVMLTYFMGVAIGAIVVLGTAPDMLGEYLAFVGAPTAVAIGFYAWKAKAENMKKLGLKEREGDADE